MNRIHIKPDHSEALEKDARRMGINPTDVLDVILTDFFRGWKPKDRPTFYKQVLPPDGRKSIVVTPEAVKILRTWLVPELRVVSLMKSSKARRVANTLSQLVEQL